MKIVKKITSIVLAALVLGVSLFGILPPTPVYAATETLRPNAAGDETNLGFEYPTDEVHYTLVDEAEADEATTYVQQSTGTGYARDLYGLPLSSGVGTINFIKVYFRTYTTGAATVRPVIKSSGIVTEGTAIDAVQTWTTYSEQWNTNPADSEAWEWSDIDALQIGIGIDAVPDAYGRCTQVYVEVDYTVSAPTVTTSAASDVEETTATLNGDVTAINDTSITDRGFVWDTATHADPGNVAPASSGYASNWTEAGTFGTGVFSHGITSLTEGELYYVRAAAKNDDGVWGYGSEVTFLTKPDEPNTFVATAGDEQVSLTWNKGTGADNTIIRGKIGGYPANYDTDVDVYSGTGTSTTHSGLNNSDHWYYRAWSYATEGGKEQYSDLYVQADATPVGPPDVNTSGASDIGLTTVTLNGEVTSLEDGSITERGFVWDTTSSGHPGNVAPASSGYASYWTEAGSWGIGTFSHGLTSLVEGETYYCRAAAQNSVGWEYGSEVSFTLQGLRLWFEPVVMTSGSILTDRSGWGNSGTINWGTNPGDVEVTVGGVLPAEGYVPPAEDDDTAPTVLPPPTGFNIGETRGADMTGMPLYAGVHRAAQSLGWSDQVTYGVFATLASVGIGFAGLIAIGSIWGFAIGFGLTIGAASSTAAIPLWIGVVSIMAVIFLSYIWGRV